VIDPAAIGTLHIGLGANDAEASQEARSRSRAARRRRRAGIRGSMARGLRWAAARLEPALPAHVQHAETRPA
jgi:hypothetical protein